MSTGGDHHGRLEVIHGCMFAGKTTELIRRVDAARREGLSAVIIKPARDTRSEGLLVRTHDGRHSHAWPVVDAREIPAAAQDRAVVGVDEAHFFGAALAAVCEELLRAGRRVIVAGVDVDHRGEPFEPFPRLLSRADEVVRLFARCARCGGDAVHSQRMFESKDRIAVGGAGQYEARCEACFEPGR